MQACMEQLHNELVGSPILVLASWLGHDLKYRELCDEIIEALTRERDWPRLINLKKRLQVALDLAERRFDRTR